MKRSISIVVIFFIAAPPGWSDINYTAPTGTDLTGAPDPAQGGLGPKKRQDVDDPALSPDQQLSTTSRIKDRRVAQLAAPTLNDATGAAVTKKLDSKAALLPDAPAVDLSKKPLLDQNNEPVVAVTPADNAAPAIPIPSRVNRRVTTSPPSSAAPSFFGALFGAREEALKDALWDATRAPTMAPTAQPRTRQQTFDPSWLDPNALGALKGYAPQSFEPTKIAVEQWMLQAAAATPIFAAPAREQQPPRREQSPIYPGIDDSVTNSRVATGERIDPHKKKIVGAPNWVPLGTSVHVCYQPSGVCNDYAVGEHTGRKKSRWGLTPAALSDFPDARRDAPGFTYQLLSPAAAAGSPIAIAAAPVPLPAAAPARQNRTPAVAAPVPPLPAVAPTLVTPDNRPNATAKTKEECLAGAACIANPLGTGQPLVVTSLMGARDSPEGMGGSTNHAGVDIRAAEGQPLFAPISGTVTRSHCPGLGPCVQIRRDKSNKSDPNIFLALGHAKSSVDVGAHVRQGEPVGVVAPACTVCTAAHLHVQINIGDSDTRKRSTVLDPILLLPPVSYKDDSLGALEQKRLKSKGVTPSPDLQNSTLLAAAHSPVPGAAIFNSGLTVANENGEVDAATAVGPYTFERTRWVGRGRQRHKVTESVTLADVQDAACQIGHNCKTQYQTTGTVAQGVQGSPLRDSYATLPMNWTRACQAGTGPCLGDRFVYKNSGNGNIVVGTFEDAGPVGATHKAKIELSIKAYIDAYGSAAPLDPYKVALGQYPMQGDIYWVPHSAQQYPSLKHREEALTAFYQQVAGVPKAKTPSPQVKDTPGPVPDASSFAAILPQYDPKKKVEWPTPAAGNIVPNLPLDSHSSFDQRWNQYLSLAPLAGTAAIGAGIASWSTYEGALAAARPNVSSQRSCGENTTCVEKAVPLWPTPAAAAPAVAVPNAQKIAAAPAIPAAPSIQPAPVLPAAPALPAAASIPVLQCNDSACIVSAKDRKPTKLAIYLPGIVNELGLKDRSPAGIARAYDIPTLVQANPDIAFYVTGSHQTGANRDDIRRVEESLGTQFTQYQVFAHSGAGNRWAVDKRGKVVGDGALTQTLIALADQRKKGQVKVTLLDAYPGTDAALLRGIPVNGFVNSYNGRDNQHPDMREKYPGATFDVFGGDYHLAAVPACLGTYLAGSRCTPVNGAPPKRTTTAADIPASVPLPAQALPPPKSPAPGKLVREQEQGLLSVAPYAQGLDNPRGRRALTGLQKLIEDYPANFANINLAVIQDARAKKLYIIHRDRSPDQAVEIINAASSRILLRPGQTQNGSNKTAMGYFYTADAVSPSPSYGVSRLPIIGLNPGWNDQALNRGVEFHTQKIWRGADPWGSLGCIGLPDAKTNRTMHELAGGVPGVTIGGDSDPFPPQPTGLLPTPYGSRAHRQRKTAIDEDPSFDTALTAFKPQLPDAVALNQSPGSPLNAASSQFASLDQTFSPAPPLVPISDTPPVDVSGPPILPAGAYKIAPIPLPISIGFASLSSTADSISPVYQQASQPGSVIQGTGDSIPA